MARGKKAKVAVAKKTAASEKAQQRDVGGGPSSPHADDSDGSAEAEKLKTTHSGNKRRQRSNVWKIMKNITPKRGEVPDPRYSPSNPVICLVCGKTFKYSKVDGSTSNMNKHIRACDVHQDVVRSVNSGMAVNEAVAAARQQRRSVADMLLSSRVKQEWGAQVDMERLKEMWAIWVVAENLPFRIIESERFREWVSFLCPAVTTWSRYSLRRYLLHRWVARKEEVKKTLKAAPGKISFTTDIWSARTQESYMCVTAHWITREWTHQSITLDFVELPGHHTGELIAQKFLQCLQEFKVHTRVGGITVDNASSNHAAIKILHKDETFNWNGYWRVHCFAHVLNLAVQDAVKHESLLPVLEKLRYLARWINKSPLRTGEFQQYIISNDVGDMKKLRRDCPTRWGSTLAMIDRAIALKPAVLDMCHKNSDDRDLILTKIPEPEEWRLLQQVQTFLQPFDKATRYCEADKYTTIHVTLVAYNQLMDQLQATKKQLAGTPLLHALDKSFRKLRSYYDRSSELLTVATMLDPTMKAKWHEMPHIKEAEERREGLKEAKKEEERKKAEEEAREAARRGSGKRAKVNELHGAVMTRGEDGGGKDASPAPGKESDGDKGDDDEEHISVRMAKAEFKRRFKPYAATVSRPPPEEPSEVEPADEHFQMMLAARKAVAALQKPTLAVDEATAYFSTPNAPLTTKLLAYWKAEEHRHPALAAMARDFLAVPATSASSERAFSFARHTVTEFRAGLSPETIRALLCLKSWLKIPQADMQDDELSDDEEEEVEEEGEDGTGEGEDEVEGDGEDEGGEDEEGGSMEDIMDVDRFFIDPNDESKVILDLVPDSDDDEY